MQSLTPYLLVGIGGMAGAVLRYAVSLAGQFITTGFPFATLTVNILGSFLIGLFAELSATTTLISPEMRLLLATGLCGGFTTFSSFMYEIHGLLQDGQIFYASLYIGLSAVGGFLALYCGILFSKIWS
ncbi:CrcB protein [Chloroherpeton thalassium ATCC 35110]|uniref:Fluoride-specific ion channel FluC n=1 Tax=Chloroherpeton thalassium (strain ATCC 35110 / GB-78) TaxID=517418 RepID=B3QV70_CHLT3|nr:fluoride efflux transporter CrcB [Chloroherpeton thalassium]ACF13024.1 CrcB protein [Chloroherpeton thalassium ATCC 35110]